MKDVMIMGNFSSDTGYAWRTITEYFLALAQRCHRRGGRAVLCYPTVNGLPAGLRLSEGVVIEFDFSESSSIDLLRVLRKYRPDILYLTDRPTFSLRYLICRLAGVTKIIAHFRTIGDSAPSGVLKRAIKEVINRLPLITVDVAVAVSDFVKRSLVEISGFPENRIRIIWNGVDIVRFCPGTDGDVRRRFGIPAGKKIVFGSSRADRRKGIEILIQAADLLVNGEGREDLFFLYGGDGPDIERFRNAARERNLAGHFLCPGRIEDVDKVTRSVDIIVVPSLCQEAFGLTVVEGMACAKIVIASRIGGIVEIVRDGENGFLVPPGDPRALAATIGRAADGSPEWAEKLGAEARRTVERHFNIEDKKRELVLLFDDVCR